MALRSMTGFARSDGSHGAFAWHWEIRTVNGRGLDVRIRLPSGFDAIEQPTREACKKHLARGNCSLTLTVQRDAGDTSVRLNEEMFRQVVRAAEQARELSDAGTVSLDGLLSVRGVLEFTEAEDSEADEKDRREAVLASLVDALKAVNTARQEEGAQLATEISSLLDEVEQLAGSIENSPARTPEAIGRRLKEQLNRLLGDADRLDEQRLHQEAVLLAAKADVEEELARLRAHLASARDMLKSREPVGRKFEFLAQEFNREANTICSKSNDTDITQAGLALKAVIDRIREQVQNIE